MTDGWHPDPTGRHGYRYFDGQAWSDHVSDEGVASVDAFVPTQTMPDASPAVSQGVPSAAGPSFRRLLLIGGLVLALVTALVLGGVLVRRAFFVGGASTPEGAVRQFVASTADFDLVGAARMVNPSEVDGLQDVYLAALKRLKEAGVADDFESVVGGEASSRPLTVSLTGLNYRTHALGKRYQWVSLDGGRYTVRWRPQNLTGGSAAFAGGARARTWTGDLRELINEAETQASINGKQVKGALGLPTVKVHGRWYVSLVGSVLPMWWRSTAAPMSWDAAAGQGLVGPADYDSEPKPIVGNTPKEAIQNLAAARPSELLRAIPVGQAMGVWPFAEGVDRLSNENMRVDVRLTGLDIDVERLDGGKRKAVINNALLYASVEQDGDTDSMTLQLRGSCWDAQESGQSSADTGCLRDVRSDFGSGGEEYSLPQVGLGEFFIVVTEVRGGYQVDPMATVVQYAREIIEGVPEKLIRVGYPEAVAEIGRGLSGQQ